MASSKNNSNSTNADSTGGFKTVAFGFDKNDVTMYIASLRKKMKQMEEEFQDKLKEALDNPAASNEALKHEREVIRSEMEAMWGDKLNERNQILKQQQNQINELEESVHEKDKIIDALRAELSAANSENGDNGEINARAAKAYVQFTTTLRSITSSLQNTLQTVERTWKGDFEDAINEIEASEEGNKHLAAANEQQAAAAPAPPVASVPEPIAEAAPVPAPVTASAADTSTQEAAVEEIKPDTDSENAKKKTRAAKKAAKEAQAPAPTHEPVKVPFEPFDFGDEEDDPLKGIIADISDDAPVEVPIKTPETQPKEAAYEETPDVPDPVQAEEVIEETAADSLDDFGDLGDLLAEPAPKPAPAKKPTAPTPEKRTPPPAPKMAVDDDLSALLADDPADNDIKASDEVVGATDDFADLLAEGSGKPDFGEDFLITEDEPAVIKGDDLDVSLLSDMVIVPGEDNNGDLGKMLKEQEANEYAQFGDLFVAPAGDDDTIGFQNIKAEEPDNEDDLFAASPNAPKKAEKNEDDLFDFSFLSSDDDEDDMSTDASFPGML